MNKADFDEFIRRMYSELEIEQVKKQWREAFFNMNPWYKKIQDDKKKQKEGG